MRHYIGINWSSLRINSILPTFIRVGSNMRILYSHEITHVSGGNDEILNGLMLGSVAGGLAGAYWSMKFISERPIFLLFPNTADNIVKLGVVGGAVAGALCGTLIGVLTEED